MSLILQARIHYGKMKRTDVRLVFYYNAQN